MFENFEVKKIESRSLESGRFLQSQFWADFKGKSGWRTMLFECVFAEKSQKIRVMTRKIAKFFCVAYIPLAPERSFFENSAQMFEFCANFSKKIRKFLPKNTIFVRFDPACEQNSLDSCKFFGLRRSRVAVQPPDTVVLDLSKSEEQLLSEMKPKWRYNIRLAQKKGVQIGAAGLENFDEFYSLFKITALRDGIAIHEKKYYENLFKTAKEHGEVKATLYVARSEGEPIAAIVTLFTKFEAVYLYGASSNEKRNLMPTYLLQWQAICDAKNFGSASYDFYGIPPTDDEGHPMHGLYRFKTGFGGQIVHRIGSFDFPTSPIFPLYLAAEALRAFYFKRVRKILKKH